MHRSKLSADAAEIDRITGIQGKLLDFSLQAITIGKDAMGEVSVRVAFGTEIVNAKAASTDIVEAGARAYLSCVNRLISRKAEISENKKTSSKKKTVRKRKTKKYNIPRPHWRELVTPECGKFINERYKQDFELFNYEMEDFL